MRVKQSWVVSGNQEPPTGYHDHLLYMGTSRWQALKAVYVALRNDMTVTIRRYPVAR